MTALRVTTAAALVLTFVLIVLGAWVRATNSGLSCPDWPTCYGHWLPLPGDVPASAGYTYFQVMLEWAHRLIAGVILGPLVVVIAVLAWRRRDLRARLAVYGGLLVFLLLVQAALGGVTVLDRNSPWSVALHLSTALLLFSVLWLIFERSRETAEPVGGGASLPVLAVAVWLAALGTMVSAAVTAKSGASLACAGWPLCNDALIPELSDPLVRLNATHRLLAAATTLGVTLLVLLIGRSRAGRGPARVALALVAAEVGIGAAVVLLRIPIWTAVLHQAIGVLAFAAITLTMWRCIGDPVPRDEPLHVRVSRARSAL